MNHKRHFRIYRKEKLTVHKRGGRKRAMKDLGFHSWTEDELARFEATWPVGTHRRLAFDLLLYTGLRRGGAVKIGRQHVRNGELSICTEKTGNVVTRPILPILAEPIAAMPAGDLTLHHQRARAGLHERIVRELVQQGLS